MQSAWSRFVLIIYVGFLQALEKENKSLKHDLKRERKDRMLCEQERNQALTKVATLEQKLAVIFPPHDYVKL